MSQHRSNTEYIESGSSDQDNFDDSQGTTDSENSPEAAIEMPPKGASVKDYEKVLYVTFFGLDFLTVSCLTLASGSRANVINRA